MGASFWADMEKMPAKSDCIRKCEAVHSIVPKDMSPLIVWLEICKLLKDSRNTKFKQEPAAVCSEARHVSSLTNDTLSFMWRGEHEGE